MAFDHRNEIVRNTPEQDKVVNLSSNLSQGEHLRVLAGSGAGKTTTLLGVANAMGERSGTFLAFNRDIVQAARKKFDGTNCKPSTFHGLCLRAVSDEIAGSPVNYGVKADLIDSGFLRRFGMRRARGWSDYRIASILLKTISEFCNSTDDQITTKHSRAAIVSSTGDPDFLRADIPKEKAQSALMALQRPVAEAAALFWREKTEGGLLSHDTYLKLVATRPDLCERAFSGSSYVVVDEAQDLNGCQIDILLKSGRSLVCVGDSAQAIYGWRGSEDRILTSLPGQVAYLTHSFRFGPNIASLANRVLAAKPGFPAPFQIVGAGGTGSSTRGPKFAIICRTNAGILEEAEGLLKRGFSYHLDKKEELLETLESAVALYQGRTGSEDIPSPAIRIFSSWQEFLGEAEFNPAYQRLVEIIDEHRVETVRQVIASSRPLSEATVAIMSGHRSKGLEFENVRLGGDWASLADLKSKVEDAKKRGPNHLTQALQEFNLTYVAITRAMKRCENAQDLISSN